MIGLGQLPEQLTGRDAGFQAHLASLHLATTACSVFLSPGPESSGWYFTEPNLLRTCRRCRLFPKNGVVGTPVLIYLTRGVNLGETVAFY